MISKLKNTGGGGGFFESAMNKVDSFMEGGQ